LYVKGTGYLFQTICERQNKEAVYGIKTASRNINKIVIVYDKKYTSRFLITNLASPIYYYEAGLDIII